MGAKDGPALDALACRQPDGTPVLPFASPLLSLIAEAKPAGPAVLTIETEASAPVDLGIEVQGQRQEVPALVVLGQTDGAW